ncbi:hypothetical protein [Zobellia uliginosa]|uniref:hypothetical protein n=1 Tax=Zobellia uliginosa TaxID=143224 RepID=UPI0026E1EAFC|nr:hypothetical protein [Zobellia uliginosa]MDO6516608.1 hypothetical protein [Zobellia uliginosa]
MKVLHLHITVLCLTVLASCKRFSFLQGQTKVNTSHRQEGLSPEQHESYTKENDLISQIQAAEKQITYTTYNYMEGAITQVILHLNKNGTGHIQNKATNRYFEIKWTEEDSIINIAPTSSKEVIPFTELKRIDRKTLLYRPENKKDEMRFYGKLNHENNLEILNLIEHMESDASSDNRKNRGKGPT